MPKQGKNNTTVNIPKTLDTPEFREAWDEWTQYRAERKLCRWVPMTQRKQLKRMAAMGVDRALEMIEWSIMQGWQGLYETRASEFEVTADDLAKASQISDDDDRQMRLII
jgi:hypothetical protein